MNRDIVAAIVAGFIVGGGAAAVLVTGQPNGQGLIRDTQVCSVPASALRAETLRRNIEFALSRGRYEQARVAQLELNALSTPITTCTDTVYPIPVH